jgi:TonB-dependent SusC/RagA subfamily outer membrane receptor
MKRKKVFTKLLIVLIPLLLSGFSAASQNKVYSGTVTEQDGTSIPGVSVVVKGQNMGTITDFDGKFSLSVPAGARALEFSFVGLKSQEIPLGANTKLTVVMVADVVGVEEVVVVGYGSQKKVNLTGAVAAVKIDEKLTSRALTNLSSGMSGLVPGLAVTQSSGMAGNDKASMLIRGLGTVNSASPLVVVDGMPDVDINRINMNDVESISVLKDAASSAVYGSRAANGVILITTKSGKGQGKTRLNFSS